jgi:hypothetical protein
VGTSAQSKHSGFALRLPPRTLEHQVGELVERDERAEDLAPVAELHEEEAVERLGERGAGRRQLALVYGGRQHHRRIHRAAGS